jgi:hypothetical protein
MKISIGPARDWFPTRTEHSTSQLSFGTPRFLWSRGVTSIALEAMRPAGRAQGKLKVLMTTMNSQPDTTQWSRFPRRCLNCCFALRRHRTTTPSSSFQRMRPRQRNNTGGGLGRSIADVGQSRLWVELGRSPEKAGWFIATRQRDSCVDNSAAILPDDGRGCCTGNKRP